MSFRDHPEKFENDFLAGLFGQHGDALRGFDFAPVGTGRCQPGRSQSHAMHHHVARTGRQENHFRIFQDGRESSWSDLNP